MVYTKQQIWEQLDGHSSDMAQFYKKSCINYRGKTSDTKEYYTEVIAHWLLEHVDLLNRISPINRRASYRMEGHDGVPAHRDSNREEELIAMAMKRQGHLPILGQVLDYQTPLKDTQKSKAGKIDLLTYDGSTLRILELKTPDSRETLLRCVLEGCTYLKTVNKTKLLEDFGLPADTTVQACPFVFYGSFQWKEAQQQRPNLRHLMDVLGCKAYYITEQNGIYAVTEE